MNFDRYFGANKSMIKLIWVIVHWIEHGIAGNSFVSAN